MRETPIRPNDRFLDRAGREWRVTECLPGGHVQLFCKAQSRHLGTYKKQIRAGMLDGGWHRVQEGA